MKMLLRCAPIFCVFVALFAVMCYMSGCKKTMNVQRSLMEVYLDGALCQDLEVYTLAKDRYLIIESVSSNSTNRIFHDVDVGRRQIGTATVTSFVERGNAAQINETVLQGYPVIGQYDADIIIKEGSISVFVRGKALKEYGPQGEYVLKSRLLKRKLTLKPR